MVGRVNLGESEATHGGDHLVDANICLQLQPLIAEVGQHGLHRSLRYGHQYIILYRNIWVVLSAPTPAQILS